MEKLILIQTGQTIWEPESRLDSLSGQPLSDLGQQQINEISDTLARIEPSIVYTSTGLAQLQTAEILAPAFDVKIKTDQRLDEIDYGLWQGLTVDEIKRRQPSLYKQWVDAPLSVRPPGGETLEEASQRIVECFEEILRKERKPSTVAMVFRPISLAILRIALEDRSLDGLWNFVNPDLAWICYTPQEESPIWTPGEPALRPAESTDQQ